MIRLAIVAICAVAALSCSRATNKTSGLALSKSAFELFDPLAASHEFSRQLDVQVRNVRVPKASRYCLSETQNARPSDALDACWSPLLPDYFNLSDGDGTKTVYLWTADESGNVSASPLTSSTLLDRVPPTLSFSDPVPTVSSATQLSIRPRASDSSSGVASVECAVDPDSPQDCGQALTVQAPTDGVKLVSVRARDRAGNTAEQRFSIQFDRARPTAQINSSPANPAAQTSASFSFSGNDGMGSGIQGFDCAIDNGAFAACTSPKDYSALAAGNHSFQVRSRDAAGNLSNVSTFSWTIDTTVPNVRITSGPASASNQVMASFSFTTLGAASVACALDGGAPQACTSPASYSGLASGSHTFTVTGRSTAGLQSTATYNWVIDFTAPVLVLGRAPVDPSASSRGTFEFAATDAGGTGLSYRCSLDGGAFAACTSPRVINGLSDGPHDFRVQAVDGAGNPSNLVTRMWTISTQLVLAVDVPSTGVTASSEVASARADLAIDDDHFTAWDSGVAGPAWVQLDLGRPVSLDHVDLQINQGPVGTSTHEVWGGPTAGSLSLLGSVSAMTSNGQVLRVNSNATGIRFLKVVTTLMPGTVSWREVRVYERKNASQVNWPAAYSYWGGEDATPFADHVTHSWARTEDPADIDLGVSLGVRNFVIYAYYIFFCTGDEIDAGTCKSNYDQTGLTTDGIVDPGNILRSDYQARWNAFLAQNSARLQHVKVVYPVDEPGGLLSTAFPFRVGRYRHLIDSLENLVIPLIKSSLPGRKVMMTFTYGELEPDQVVNPGLVFRIPQGLDWVAFDCYGPWKRCGPHGYANSWKSIPTYVNQLAAKMSPGQELFLIPDASSYIKTGTDADIEQELKNRAELYYALALNDSRVRGMMPFYYANLPPIKGLESYPAARDRWREIGKTIFSQ